MHTIDEDVFAEASLFNFQNRVTNHYVQTGEDLIREVFDALTSDQMQEFGISTEIQRGDSFLIGSNIFDYNRLQLLIEVLLRFIKQMEAADLLKIQEELAPYAGLTAGQYIYRVTRDQLSHEMDKIAHLYQQIYHEFGAKYRDVAIFKILERVFYEHFVVEEQQVKVRESTEIGSDVLMSPDDPEATFRKKGKVESKGFIGHISETSDPDNPLNLITDYTVECNNVDDAAILEKRLPLMQSLTPDIKEYFMDGMYGSPANDKLMEVFDITPYQTNIRGKKSRGQIRIQSDESGNMIVTCGGGQRILPEKAKKRWKAVFDYDTCKQCPLFKQCALRTSGVKTGKPKRTYYFDDTTIRIHQRAQAMNKLPPDKQNIRANVEATIKELKRGMRNGKVRVRGKINIVQYLAFTSIAVNLGRIHRFLSHLDAFWPFKSTHAYIAFLTGQLNHFYKRPIPCTLSIS